MSTNQQWWIPPDGSVVVWNATQGVNGYSSSHVSRAGGIPTVSNSTLPFFNVQDYGAKGDGITDDSVALQAAINATPFGGNLWIPPTANGYKFSTGLTVSKTIQIVGGGWGSTVNAVYGNSSWNIGNNSGSILYYTGTGTAFTAVHVNLYNRLVLKDLAFIGPGTTGTIGLSIGQQALTHIPIDSRFDNILIGNFDSGAIVATEDTLFIDMAIGGCNTVGFHGLVGADGNGFNQNSFINCKWQTCGGFACQLTGGQQTGFYSPLFQANTGTSLRLESAVGGLWIEGAAYFESASGTHALDLNNCNNSHFSNLHLTNAPTTDNINLVNSTNNIFDWPAQNNTKVTLDVNSSGNWFMGQWSASTITDASGGNFFIITGTANGTLDVRSTQATTQQIMSWGPFSGPNWGLWDNGGITLFRDLANGRYHILLTPGASATAATTEINSSLKIDGNFGAYGTTPIAKPSATGSATGYTAGATAATFHSDDTYTGNTGTTAYTINGIVAALKNLGWLTA